MDKRQDRGQVTRQHILTTATRLFTETGYSDTSIELVLQACGISRGALYHHFVNKEALFVAVLEAVEVSIAERVRTAAQAAPSPFAALRAGCAAWLALARDPTVRQVVLIDAPAVLGWEAWRDLDNRYILGLLKAGLARAAAAGWGHTDLVDLHAHMLLAALIEVALLVARAADAESALQQGQQVVEQFLYALEEDTH